MLGFFLLKKEMYYNSITDAFQKILDESERQTNKILVDKSSSKFYNKTLKSWLEKSNAEMYAA